MKKVIFGCMAAAMVACTVSSCKNTSAKMENATDTLSYAAGVMYSEGLNQYVFSTVDSAYINEVYKGMQDGFKGMTEKEKAYNMGIQLGDQLKNQIIPMLNDRSFANKEDSINGDVFINALIASAKGEETIYNTTEAAEKVQATQEDALEKKMAERYAENKAAGIAWLENNKNAEGVVTTESGLQYKIIKLGNGEKPTENSVVECNYRGTLIDGTEFDSSYKRNESASFPLTNVIAGWTEGFQLMPEGTRFELYVPYQLAYKAQDRGTIKPFSTLIFEIEFIKIKE